MSPPQVSDTGSSSDVKITNVSTDSEKTENVTSSFASGDVKIATASTDSEKTENVTSSFASCNVKIATASTDNKKTENVTSSFVQLTTGVRKVNIATLVFFDLETTGLAKYHGDKNVQITEISMIAVGRKEFCTCASPHLSDIRVVHKLSLCIKPKCPIPREASCLTGLTDGKLQDQSPFDENTATLITSFLAQLPKPVCLLAHNGKRFDFPILKAEFEKLNLHLPSDFYIGDTLIGFRTFGTPELSLNEKLHKDVKFKSDGTISYALKNLHLYFFGKNYIGSHSSEGDCVALAKVCHKVRDKMIPWIQENCFTFEAVKALW